MEGQPCAGMFFIVTGQVAILARRPSPAPVDAEDGDAEPTPNASADLQASQWNAAGPATSWWGQAGAGQQSAGEIPPCSCCVTASGSNQMSAVQTILSTLSSPVIICTFRPLHQY